MTTSPQLTLDWSETQKWIGQELLIEPRWGADAVEMGTIRRALEVIELGCPLHYDEKVAKQHGFKTVVAPFHMLQVYATSAIWSPGEGTVWPTDDRNFTVAGTGRSGNVKRPPTHGSAGFVTDLAVEGYRPLVLGDRLKEVSYKLVSLMPRWTRVGEGAFMTWESVFEDQNGEKAGKVIMTTYSYVPAPSSGGGDQQGQQPAQGQERKPVKTDNPVADWSKQRYWEDVKDGEALPEVRYPLPLQRLVMAAGGIRDFNAIHHNTQVAQSGGAPEAYAMNYFIHGTWERVAREWIGLGGVIHKIGPFRMRVFNVTGDTMVVSGKVTRKYEEKGKKMVELELVTTSARGGHPTVGPGPVIVSLPSRKK